MKLFISPNYQGVPAHADNGGIRRVVEAEIRHLGKYGVEVVYDIKKADVVQVHGSTLDYSPGKPIVHTGHGFMWSRQPWGEGMQEVNRLVTESMTRAVAHTSPSEWVANAIRRGGLWYPEVIYHGVDAADFEVPGEHGKYVLWNKARADHVSDPGDMQSLARWMEKRPFVTTIGRKTSNVRVLGTVPYEEMKRVVAGAGVYLATARETFGIGTLEAMASGVPKPWRAESRLPGGTGAGSPRSWCRAKRDTLHLPAINV